MGTLIRSYDWENSSLGSIDSWPQSLYSALSICLNSNFPIAIYWGKDLTLLYNDAWSPIPGNKHPWALGKPAREVWPDIWDEIEPQFQKAFNGEPGGSKNALLPMQRHGYTEECYFDFTFTPVYGESSNVEGVFNAVIETTYYVFHERRTAFLKNLALTIAAAKTKMDLFSQAVAFLTKASPDVSFAMIYQLKDNEPVLIASTLSDEETDNQKKDWPFEIVLTAVKPLHIEDISAFFEHVPKNYWTEEIKEGYIIPLTGSAGNLIGILVCGLNARRRFDGEYAIYLDSIGNTIGTAYNIIAALEEERKKAEALAEIDKAKTVFFSNISHEFRTPLTLILGSLEELLKKPVIELGKENHSSVETTHRNAIRLLRLVNNLLDFSRIEAGKAKAQYQLTDLTAFTEQIAGSFRSIIENAGLKFTVVCNPNMQSVYVDRTMWEKIVLNLLSNAFKYTLEGSITVTLTTAKNQVLLKVKDTGVGIPEKDIPKMFERFHRVENITGRTYEGTGIGLSLISELVKLHQGTITVQSKSGEGSEFTVTLPSGKEHLPKDQIVDADVNDDITISDMFIAEAATITANASSDKNDSGFTAKGNKPVVLVVDDNADMRQYFNTLLQKDYSVITAGNGMDALQKLKEELPALIVSDVMMPVMNGIELLTSIKENVHTAAIPVILVSARAGESEKIEGFDLGADDYLVKPFSSNELLARVRSQINISKKRNDTLQEVYNVFDAVPFAVAVLKGESLIIEFINQYNLKVWQKTREEVLGKPLFEARPDIREGAEPIHKEVFRTGRRFSANEIPLEITIDGKTELRYFHAIIDPLFNEQRKIIGQLATSIEITEQVVARKKIEESEKSLKAVKEQLELTIENVPAAVYLFDNNGKILYANNPAYKNLKSILGDDYDPAEDLATMMKRTIGKVEYNDEDGMAIPEEKYPTYAALKTGKEAELFIKRINKITGEVSWFLNKSTPLVNENGYVQYVLSTSTDLTLQKNSEEKIRESENRFRTLADALPQMVWMRDMQGNIEYGSKHWEEYSGIRGVSEAWREMVHPDDWNNIIQTWEKHFASGEPLQYEVRLKNKEGEYRWHNAVAEPLKDGEGKIIKWIGAVSDIHIQKRFSENLEKLVTERTEALERSNQDLQQFAHVASHDLKEPVRKVMTFSNRMRDELGRELSAKSITYLSKIESSAIRMYSMIDGVLLYSSLDALEQTKESVDLNELIQNIVSDLEILISQKNAKIHFDNLPIVAGSPILLYQLFYNLINNSLKFARESVPPIITLSTKDVENTKLHSSKLKDTVKYIALMLQDNGIGFRNEDAEKIFDTFTRLHAKDKYEGTGLGLSLCRKIVERHGGIIYAQGEEKVGATFVILLPE